MRNLSLLALSLVLLVSGFVAAEQGQYLLVFDQQVSQDSSALYTGTIDFSAFSSYFSALGSASSAEAEQKFKDNITQLLPLACEKVKKKDKTFECETDNLSLVLRRNFTANEGYYTFEVTGEFPYRTYRVIVNKIPLDKFGKVLQQSLGKGSSETETAFSVFSEAKAIDFKKTEDNALSSAGFKMLGLNLLYNVEMPGEITSATSGGYNAVVSGSTAGFNLVDVMENSAPLVVESRELNVFLFVMIGGVILLVLLTLAFLNSRKKPSTSADPGRAF